MSALHDQIVFWIIDQLPGLIGEQFTEDWSDEERSLWSSHEQDQLPEKRIEWDTQWEHPITVKTRELLPPRIEGYIDLRVVIRRKTIFKDEGRCFLGSERIAVWNFEAKPKIDSLGEVLRQINRYKVFCGDRSVFYVVSPDARYADVFHQQGIRFLHAFGGQLALGL